MKFLFFLILILDFLTFFNGSVLAMDEDQETQKRRTLKNSFSHKEKQREHRSNVGGNKRKPTEISAREFYENNIGNIVNNPKESSRAPKKRKRSKGSVEMRGTHTDQPREKLVKREQITHFQPMLPLTKGINIESKEDAGISLSKLNSPLKINVEGDKFTSNQQQKKHYYFHPNIDGRDAAPC